MRLLDLFLLVANPHSGAAASGARVADDGSGLVFLVGVLCLSGMYLCFWRGCGELYDWWQRRGWRAAKDRRPLK